MEKFFNQIKRNAFLAVIVSIILGAIVLYSTKIPADWVVNQLQGTIKFDFYTRNAVSKFFMLLFSLILIGIVNGSLRHYGFQKPKNIRYLRFFLVSLGIIIASFIVGNIVFNTTILGLLAAYYREKSGSIYPAIFVHFLANVVGSLPALLLPVG